LGENALLWLGVIVYALLGIYLLQYYRYQINPDGISYISIAKKYLLGDFYNAVNGYWGPMISWLMVPFLSLQIEPLVAAKLQALVIGGITLIGMKWLLSKFSINRIIRELMLFSSIPVLLYFALFVISPDIHIVCALVCYFSVIFGCNYPENIWKGILCGFIGGMAYLSKSYAFPFFICHFVILNFMHYIKSLNKLGVIKNTVFGLIVFIIVSGCWVGIISYKYKTITIGTAGVGNYRLVLNPENENAGVGLQIPPNESALSAHEDPSFIVLEAKSWKITNSFKNLNHYMRQVIRNLIQTKNILTSFSILSFTIIFAHMFLNAYASNKSWLQYNTIFPLVSVILYLFGYTLILVEERYLWIVLILLFLMGGYLITFVLNNKMLRRKWEAIIVVIFLLSFLPHQIIYLLNNVNVNKDIYLLSNMLTNQYNIRGNIASNKNPELSLAVSYYLNSKYFGTPKGSTGDDELLKDLRKYNINYYFSWGDKNETSLLGFSYREVNSNGVPKLRIYCVD